MAATVNTIPRSFQQWPASYAPAPVNVTPPDFNLDAGLYALLLSAAVWGTATLQKLLPDGVTYVPVYPAIAANGPSVQLQLAAGQYQLTLAGVTTLKGEIALISRGPIK